MTACVPRAVAALDMTRVRRSGALFDDPGPARGTVDCHYGMISDSAANRPDHTRPRCCIEARLSRKSALGAVAGNDAFEEVNFRAARRRPSAGGGSGGRCGVSVELEEVVRRGDQSPFGADGGSASSSEAVDAAVELGVGEDRLDDRLALAVELAAAVAG
jgi:hypothetical protein